MKLLYRILRNNMVARCKRAGWTWNKINNMLRLFGQCEVKNVAELEEVAPNAQGTVKRVVFFTKKEQQLINAERAAVHQLLSIHRRQKNR